MKWGKVLVCQHLAHPGFTSQGTSPQGGERVNGDRALELQLPELAPRSLIGAHGMLISVR